MYRGNQEVLCFLFSSFLIVIVIFFREIGVLGLILSSNRSKAFGFIFGILLLVLLMCASIVYGYTDTSWKMAYHAFTQFDDSNEHYIITDVRLPRSLIAAIVGACLAVAGAIMQTLTKNPLASPGILGINAGAGFFVVVGISFFYITSLQAMAWLAFFGAFVSAVIVYGVGSFGREGLTPMKLTLAGSAIAALFSSLTQGILVMNESAFHQVLFWLAGSVQGRKLELLTSVLPYIGIAFICSMLLASKLNVLMMGESVAKGLGLRTGLVKVVATIAIILLAGSAVAVAGPIGFIGIVIPHLAKFLVGVDHRWILPYSAILGGILLVIADIGARYIIMPQEVPVGVMTAIIGTPIFIYIARRRALPK